MNWQFWLELVVRSAALLIAGETLRRISKTRSAAFRHSLLLWVFALLALLPVLSILLPEIHLPLWQTSHNVKALVTIQELSSTALHSSDAQRTNWLLMVWLTGVFLAFTPLLIGTLSAWSLVRRATPLARLAFQLPETKPQILLTAEAPVPFTCGFVRPRIVLPAAAEHWSSLRLEAVLSHELAHVRRRDVAAQVFAHLIAALWWFQPLVWVLRRNLREESELACDAEALRRGLLPSSYGAELLAVAKTLGGDYNFSSSAISMVRSCDLEKRLHAILNPSPALRRPARTYALVFALGAIAIAASALTPNTNTLNPQGGSIMKRTFLSTLLTAASLSAATVGGTISDPTGAPIPDVKVFVYNPDTSAKQEAATGSDGRFSFPGVAAGQYILRVEKPGFTSLFREFDVKANSSVAREFTMTNEGGQPVADKIIGTDEQQSKPVRIGGEVMSSNLITQVQPVYPMAAKTAGTQGTVEIETSVSKDGVPVELRILSSPSDDLSQSSLEAVRQWRYRPTLLNGSPVEVSTVVVVHYTLSR